MIQQERVIQRISIDVSPEDHRNIKTQAAIHGNSIREYVLESIRERMRHDIEEKNLLKLTTSINPVLKELWNNDLDAAYDRL